MKNDRRKTIHHAKRTIEYFNEWASKTKSVKYEGYFKELMEIKIFTTLKYLGKEAQLLDAGCGIGNVTGIITDYCGNMVGVDFSSINVRQAKDNLRNKKNAEVMLADITSIPLQDAKFDVIVSYSTLYYIEKLSRALQEFHRILRDGGYVVFELGNKYSWNAFEYRWQSGVIQHLRSPKEMAKLIKENGFSVEETRILQLLPFHRLPKFSSFVERIFSKKIGGRLVEEWISSTPLFKNFSFRYIFVCKKKSVGCN